MTEHRFEEDDAVEPASIAHRCEEIWNGKSLEQSYNYLVYTFEHEGKSYTARAYLAEIDKVSIYGPDGAATFPEPVLAYLKRRYRKILRLAETGYATLWKA